MPVFFIAAKFLAAFSLLKFTSAVCSLSVNKSAIATILTLAFSDMELITAVPLLPQPIMPNLTAEFTLVPNTRFGLMMLNAETVAAALRKFLSFIFYEVDGEGMNIRLSLLLVFYWLKVFIER